MPADKPGAHPVALLYNDHHGWLHHWLRQRLGNTADAADLAHDTFLRLLARPRDIIMDTPGDARAYLGTIARGLLIDLWRRRQIEQAWLQALAARPDLLAPSAERQAIVLETLCEIDAMLRSLPERVTRAFLMAQLDGMTYAAIAGELDVSERMVKKYMARAMLHCAAIEAGLPAPSAGTD